MLYDQIPDFKQASFQGATPGYSIRADLDKYWGRPTYVTSVGEIEIAQYTKAKFSWLDNNTVLVSFTNTLLQRITFSPIAKPLRTDIARTWRPYKTEMMDGKITDYYRNGYILMYATNYRLSQVVLGNLGAEEPRAARIL